MTTLLKPLTAAGVLLAMTAGSVPALTIDFEAPNYSPTGGEDDLGVLARQGNEPPPHSGMEVGCDFGEVGCWRNEFNPDGFRVASGVGLDGSNGIVNSGTNFYRYLYETDDSLLDFIGGATFDNTASTLFYNLSFKLDNVSANDAVNTTAFEFGVAGQTSQDTVMELIIQDKNALGIRHGDGNTFTSSFNQSANDPMRAPGEWQTLSGEIDYAAQTFTVFINDIQWTFQSPDGEGNYRFRPLRFNDPDDLAFSIDGANLSLVANNGQTIFDPDFVLDDIRLTSIAPAVPGDYDGNGSVGEEDYSLWASSFGSTVLLDADGNGDGVVDAADYTVWRDNLPAPPATAIPEPASAALLLLAGITATSRRRRSH